jgi:hypothetical protein
LESLKTGKGRKRMFESRKLAGLNLFQLADAISDSLHSVALKRVSSPYSSPAQLVRRRWFLKSNSDDLGCIWQLWITKPSLVALLWYALVTKVRHDSMPCQRHVSQKAGVHSLCLSVTLLPRIDSNLRRNLTMCG